MKFNKNRWIMDALRNGYLKAFENGELWKHSTFTTNPDGSITLSSLVRQMKEQTHKPTGRVYVNLTWRVRPGSDERVTKSVLVNRVIALAFLPNPQNLPQVNHVDGDKEHNYLRQPTPELIAKWGEFQLEWSSGADNEKHAHRTGLKTGRGSQNSMAKLDARDVIQIRALAETKTITEIAKEFSIARSTVTNIVNKRTWAHI